MEHGYYEEHPKRPPLRTFRVMLVNPAYPEWANSTTVQAHLVFNNKLRGEGLVFRRYYNDSVKTEIVAEFEPGYFAYYEEISVDE